MAPSRLQVPPAPYPTLQIVVTDPVPIAIFFSFPVAKKPSCSPSGDQNGNDAFSVAGSGCAVNESKARIQSRGGPSAADAAKATRRPSGDSTAGPELVPMAMNCVSGGGGITARADM